MSDVRHHTEGQLHHVALIGPLTIAEASETRVALLAALEPTDKAGDVCMDVSGITDFDTAGAQLLVSTARWLRLRGQIPQLSAASPSVQAVARALGTWAPDQCCGFGRMPQPGVAS